MPKQENLLVLELDRRHIGCLVKIVTEDVSIIGRLERIDHHDAAAWDLDGAPLRRDLMTELRISGWRAEVNPQQLITVEEKPAQLADARRNLDTLRRIAAAIEDREGRDDVVQGEIVVHPDADGYTPPFTVPAAVGVAHAGTIGPKHDCGERPETGAWHCAPGYCSKPGLCPLNVLDPDVKWEPGNE